VSLNEEELSALRRLIAREGTERGVAEGFALTGDARLLGVGNGDPRSLEPDHASARSAFNGLCMAIVQAGDKGGPIRLKASADGLAPAMLPLMGKPT